MSPLKFAGNLLMKNRECALKERKKKIKLNDCKHSRKPLVNVTAWSRAYVTGMPS